MFNKKWLLAIPVILVAAYVAGPSPASPTYDPALPQVPSNLVQLKQQVQQGEALHKLKKNNEARIVWANDSVHQKTPYSIVYLHGFTASQEEGEPVHRNVARHFGYNLYLSRLAEHGIDTTDQLVNLTPEKYWESAKRAYAIGKQLGEKVILMGTSTGGTLALKLASENPEIAGIVLMSPNIEINDPNAWLLNNHWGMQIAEKVIGGKYLKTEDNRPVNLQYWNGTYRIEAAVALQELLETTMNKSTFGKVTQPSLLLYYYKDEVHQDSVVKVPAMKQMFEQLGTPAALKKAVAVPTAGNHVMGSYIKSKDVVTVEREIIDWLEKTYRKK
jgi:esterase/lipase